MNTKMDVLAVMDKIRDGRPTVARHRILIGESEDPARRGDKKVVAFTDARYRCHSWDQLVELALATEGTV